MVLKTVSGTQVDELVEQVRLRRALPTGSERRRIREQAGVSLREVASAVGVSQMAVVRWEKGAQPRNPTQRLAYCRLLDELERIGAP